jgi:hypothetical protein
MDTLNTNTTLVVSPPAKPTDPALLRKISALLSELEEVREAHLPEVIEIGAATQSRLMLFVVVDDADNTARVEKALARQFGGRLRFGGRLEYRIVTAEHSMLQNIRDTNSIVGWRD